MLPNSLKRLGCVLSCLCDWCTLKNTCGPLEHAQPLYFYLTRVNVCMCVAAMRMIITRYTAQNVMRICMLPRELIWERLAPSHTGVTQ